MYLVLCIRVRCLFLICCLTIPFAATKAVLDSATIAVLPCLQSIKNSLAFSHKSSSVRQKTFRIGKRVHPCAALGRATFTYKHCVSTCNGWRSFSETQKSTYVLGSTHVLGVQKYSVHSSSCFWGGERGDETADTSAPERPYHGTQRTQTKV